MDIKTQKRLKFLINIAYAALVIGLFFVIFRYCIGVIFPILFAAFLAFILQKPLKAITGKLKLPRGLISTLLVLLCVAVIACIVGFIGFELVDKIKEFGAYLAAEIRNPQLLDDIKNGIINAVRVLPDNLEASIVPTIQNFSLDALFDAGEQTESSAISSVGSIFSILSKPVSGALSIAKNIPSFLLSAVISIVAACFLTADFDTLSGFIYRQVPKSKLQKASRAKALIIMSLKKITRAYILIILITTVELSLGFGILKLIGVLSIETTGYIFLIAFLTALIDIIPVLGTGTVLIPWGIISFIIGNIGMGVGIFVIYITITVIRQVLEPKIVAGQFDLPAFATIISMYIGIKIFGPLGIFILPLTVIILKLLADENLITFFHTKKGDENAAVKENNEG